MQHLPGYETGIFAGQIDTGAISLGCLARPGKVSQILGNPFELKARLGDQRDVLIVETVIGNPNRPVQAQTAERPNQ